jgi:phosphoserine phosphatase RsbU/P
MPSEAPPEPASQRRPLRVLLVEDSRLDAAALVQLLRVAGWRVESERVDQADALKAALARPGWDLILCDHTMPAFSAPEALQIVRESGLDIPFIIISAGIAEQIAVEAMRQGAHDFLMKDSLGRLAPAVERELREAAVRRAKRSAEEALRESELRYRSVWENSTDAVLLADLQGVIRFANPAVRSVFGWDPSELAGNRLDVLQPPDLPAGTWWAEFSSGRTKGARLASARRRDGDAVDVDLAPATMTTGDQRWVVVFARDVTERLQAERELRKNREELSAAREIQQRLFPRSAPQIPGFDIAGVSHPAEAAGGDYFDFLPMADGALALVVADVSGHGVGPALLMAETRAYLRPLARRLSDPAELLTRTAELLIDDLGAERFVTILFARFDPVARRIIFANAGHPAGLVLASDGVVKHRLARSGRPLGRQAGRDYTAGPPIVLDPGDLLLLLTDGIDEAMNAEGECFGLERAGAVAVANRLEPASTIVERVCDAARAFAAPQPPADDLTVLVVRVL